MATAPLGTQVERADERRYEPYRGDLSPGVHSEPVSDMDELARMRKLIEESESPPDDDEPASQIAA